jgi:hypothetical protein
LHTRSQSPLPNALYPQIETRNEVVQQRDVGSIIGRERKRERKKGGKKGVRKRKEKNINSLVPRHSKYMTNLTENILLGNSVIHTVSLDEVLLFQNLHGQDLVCVLEYNLVHLGLNNKNLH